MIVTLEIAVQNGAAQKAADLVKQSLASARDWDGCLGIAVAFSTEADVVFVFEHWQSDEHAEKYREWRRASNAPDVLTENGLKADAPRRRVFEEVPRDAASDSADDPRSVVERFLESLASGDTAEIVSHLADDAIYWVAGSREGLGVALPKSAFADMHRGGADMYVDRRLEITPTGWTVQGERVAVEAKGFGEMTNGKCYTNEYHYLCVVREGKIVEVREYNDTDHLVSVLMS